jgi:hypothetical protein
MKSLQLVLGLGVLSATGILAIAEGSASACSGTDICINDSNSSFITYTGADNGLSVKSTAGGLAAVVASTAYNTDGVGLSAYGSLGYAVYGESDLNYGVYGYTGGSGLGASSASGVFGTAIGTSGNGVVGSVSNTWSGVAGLNTYSGSCSGQACVGVFGSSTNGYAGYFTGVVYIGTGLNVGGTCISGSCSESDRRLKKNIEPLTGALDSLLKLRGVTFEWKAPDTTPEGHGDEAGTQTGFIAQEVEGVFPTWVGGNSKGFKTLNIPPKQMAALTVEAFRVSAARTPFSTVHTS